MNFDGFIREFPWLRVDSFDGARLSSGGVVTKGGPGASTSAAARGVGDAPFVSLLTHAHTDHTVGLDTFEGVVYCTAATKEILENSMEAAHRFMWEERLVERKEFKYRSVRKHGRTNLRCLEYNTPTEIEGPNQTSVTVTALDANHCPGSAMYLIEGVGSGGKRRAVLHTGDVRAEPWWTAQLARNPLVAKYLRQWEVPLPSPSPVGKGKERVRDDVVRLDAIYLDTTSVLEAFDGVPKESAIRGLIEAVRQYPSTTKFYMNAWTYGYEEAMVAVAQAFREPIHLDWFKRALYSQPNLRKLYPFLASASNSEDVRFHACERRWKCDAVWGSGQGCFELEEEIYERLQGPKKRKRVGCEPTTSPVVYINFVEMSAATWKVHEEQMGKRFGRIKRWEDKSQKVAAVGSKGEQYPDYLAIPLARHSKLPELRNLVDLFKPKTLYPLTTRPTFDDYLCLSAVFRGHLGPGAEERISQQASEAIRAARLRGPAIEPASDDDIADVIKRVFAKVGRRTHDIENVEGGDRIAADISKLSTPAGPGAGEPSLRNSSAADVVDLTLLSDVEDDAAEVKAEAKRQLKKRSRSPSVGTIEFRPVVPPPKKKARPPVLVKPPPSSIIQSSDLAPSRALLPTTAPSPLKHKAPLLAAATSSQDASSSLERLLLLQPVVADDSDSQGSRPSAQDESQASLSSRPLSQKAINVPSPVRRQPSPEIPVIVSPPAKPKRDAMVNVSPRALVKKESSGSQYARLETKALRDKRRALSWRAEAKREEAPSC